MYNVRSEDRTSAEEQSTRLKLNSMRVCLQDKLWQWLGHQERQRMLGLVNVEPSS